MTDYGDAGGYDYPVTYAALDNHEQRFNQNMSIRKEGMELS